MTREQFDALNFLAGQQEPPSLQIFDFFEELTQRTNLPDDVFLACAKIYALGVVHGIRKERSRRNSASRASVKGGAES